MPSDERGQLLGPAAAVSLFSFLGLAVAFATQLALAALFGAGADMDAYLAATTLPQFVVAVLVNSLNFVFIPLFVEHERSGDSAGAWKVASAVIGLSGLGLGALALFGIVLAEPLQRALVPGFDPGTLSLTIRMAQISWPTVVTQGLGALLGGLYQAHRRFGWAASATVLGSSMMLAATLALAPRLGITGVAWAGLLGSVAQLAFLSPVVLRESRFRFSIKEQPAAVRRALRLLAPLVVGALFSRAAVLVDRFVASMLEAGSLAYIGYANKLVTVAVTVLASGLSITAFVRMSEHATGANHAGFRETLAARLRLMWFLVTPAVTIGMVVRVEFVALLFQRGEFSAMDTAAVAGALPWYLVAMIAMALGGIVSSGYYALQDTTTPALLAVAEVAAYAVYMPMLASRFQVPGVALGFAVYWHVSLAILGALLWWKMGRHLDTEFVRSVAMTLVAGILAATAAWLGRAIGGPNRAGAVGLGIVFGLAAYFFVLGVLRSRELRLLLGSIRERLAPPESDRVGVIAEL